MSATFHRRRGAPWGPVVLAWAVASLPGCGGEGSARRTALPDRVDFNFDVKPILSDRCFQCHGPDPAVREAEFRLDTEEGAFSELAGEPGAYAIVPGDLETSVLYRRISSTDPNEVMPPPGSHRTLSEYEIRVLARWIEQGAEWRKHWAFIVPERLEPPETDRAPQSPFGGNEIDAFVGARLEREGLRPTRVADRETLLRRVTLDLTGLPPTLEELDAFLDDASPSAYARAVQRLLESPAYGEKMASHWLDAARYADSHGYQDDLERSIWPWRDWVIHAFNENLPYDDFGTWQLAGDLLDDATSEQILATGFNRNHMITQEGGVIDEEFRVAYVADRTATTGTVFLGMTFDCARCHDHKFDPVSQRDYFGLFGFFNQVPEKGVIDYGTLAPTPALALTYDEVRRLLPFVRGVGERDTLRTMVMADMDTLVRPTHVLERGRYDKPLDEVDVQAPSAILPFGDERPRNRLGLADWLFDSENPLTARVAVNRMWSVFFGRGLVHTIDDFGNQGAIPSHPELLDWLATSFVESGWDTKAMLETIVMSATYQQSSSASADLLDRDPDNELLARGPQFRLSAEALRDQLLAASGLLVRELGGPSVKPYQPEGIWEEKTGGGGGSLARYVQDTGDELYRRSLYTFWKRTVPPPSMMAFDAPDRSLTAVHRQTTSTPLQSLVLMNDPQSTEAARALAYRLLETGASAEERVATAFRLLTSRRPSPVEAGELLGLLNEELRRMSNDPAAADALLAVGELAHPDGVERHEAAAYAVVVTAIFNLYETITRS